MLPVCGECLGCQASGAVGDYRYSARFALRVHLVYNQICNDNCKYGINIMGSITIRINNELKEKSYAVLERLGVTPSELLRQALEYVAEQERLPFKAAVLTDEDEELLAIVRERLDSPAQRIRISLDEL